MNFFKKALVATAVVASFGASATATVSSTPVQMSQQGISIGNVAHDVAFSLDFVIGTLTPAASTITLTFDKEVDLTDLDGLVTVDMPVSNNVSNGTGTIGAAGLQFDYGTGSFTFDKVNVDTSGTQHTMSFVVNLGNPIFANSAFRVTFVGVSATGTPAEGGVGASVDIEGAADVAYTSVDSAAAPIEMGTGIVSQEVTQFEFASKSPWNGLIDRALEATFVKNADTTLIDTVVFTASNDEALAASIVGATASLELAGDFDNGSTLASGDSAVSAMFTSAQLTAATGTVAADFNDVTYAVAAGDLGIAGADVSVDVVYTNTTKVIPQTGDIEATLTITDGTNDFDFTADAGEWKLDATIINVPYFPVGYTDTSSSIHFANESSSDADVIVTAIDNNGEEYGPMNLSGVTGFADGIEANTVRKVSQTHLMDLLTVPAGTKISVTFNIDSDVGDVNAYAFSQKVGEGRQALVTSQQKGSDK